MTTVPAGKAVVQTGVQDNTKKGVDSIEKRFKAMSARLSRLSRKTATAAAAIGAPLVLAAKGFASAGDKLDKMSKRTGIAVEELSRLQYAAEQSGTDIDQLSQAMFRATRRIGNAITETGPAKRALDELGLSASRLASMAPADQFEVLVDALGGVGNEARRSQLGFEIFGDNWRQLQPLINQGSENIRKLKSEADALGLTMSSDAAASAAALSDAMNSVTNQVKMAVVQIGGALAPSITEMVNATTPIIANVIEWVKANGEFIQTGAKVAATLGAISVAMKGLSIAISTNPFALLAAAAGEAVMELQRLRNMTGGGGGLSIGGSATSLAAGRAMQASSGSGLGRAGAAAISNVQQTKWLRDAMQKLGDRMGRFSKDVKSAGDRILQREKSIMPGVEGILGGAGFGNLGGAQLGSIPVGPTSFLDSFTTGQLGSAAFSAVGGPSTPMNEIAEHSATQTDLLQQIERHIQVVRDR